MPPPLLVVEIVSPGEVQRNRDYVAKRMQYQDLGVPEYWIVNPEEETVLVLEWQANGYGEDRLLQGADGLESARIGSLNLATQDLFTAAKGKD